MKNQSSNENIGKRVNELRKHHHLTQAQLAELIGSTSKHISEIERGITGISIDTQVLLADKLCCSLDYLIKGIDYKTVELLLPSPIVEILRSNDMQEIELLIDYLNLYLKIHQKE